MKYCPKCGAHIKDQARFCTKCGAKVPELTQTPVTQSSELIGSNPLKAEEAIDTPVFTPPANDTPVFTPPVRRHYNGPACYHHPDEPAAGQCARCGKYVCQDCLEVYTVTSGEYANRCLCYDCCQVLVAENVELLKKQKSKIIVTFAATIIGMIIGASLFSSTRSSFGILFGMLWIGSFWVWIKGAVIGWWKNPMGRSLSGFIGSCLGSAIVAPYNTVKKIVQCIIYLRKTSAALVDDQAALRDMKDYMEYTLVRSQNKGVDLETLMGQDSALYNNSYANAVRTQGEEAADARLRQCTTTIAENGEIIRNFAA